MHSGFSEEVYMQHLFCLSHPPNKKCWLRRPLFGLTQASWAWFTKFSSIISLLGYSTNFYDFVLFLHLTNKGTILHLLYVIDLIITDDDLNGIQELNNFLSQQIDMKDLGNLNYFIGLYMTSLVDGFYLSQAKHNSIVSS